MAAVGPADLVLANGHVFVPHRHSPADTIAIRGKRIAAVSRYESMAALIGPRTTIIDAAGGLIAPALHDAHLHLLSWARQYTHLDCRAVQSVADLQQRIAHHARSLASDAWIMASGYDDAVLMLDKQYVDRFDLDVAGQTHPIRLRHRTLHLDVLNTAALERLGLWDLVDRRVERDPATGTPTGRVFNGGDFLRERLARPTEADVAADVRRASNRLLAWGITSVQDASISNGLREWSLFERLAVTGALGVRMFMLPGLSHWREIEVTSAADGLLRRGPVKVMLDEATLDGADAGLLFASTYSVRSAGSPVAIHAVSDAEIAVALDMLTTPAPCPLSPNRIEHAALLPDNLIEDIRASGATVVGQPALVFERGDVYRREHPPAQWAWLHRAASLLRAGVSFAIGSDAPVATADPSVIWHAARTRRTSEGALLGPREALGPRAALQAMTYGPAKAVGMANDLGILRAGALADIAVLDPETLAARVTVFEGRVVWRKARP